MSYAWIPGEPPATFLTRVAETQLRKALAPLEGEEMPSPDEIHDIRKRLKKLRGLLRLFRGAAPFYAEENAAYRDAARILAPLRDAAAVLESYERLRAAGLIDAEATRPFREGLEAAQAEAETGGEAPGRRDEVRLRLEAALGRVADWELTEDGWGAVAPGLTETYRRGRKGLKAAESREGEALHDWRKRVKYHWYHARLLSPVWPEALAPHVAAASALSDLLGDRHDLDVLAAALPGGLESAAEEGLREALCTEARRLEDAAFAIGQKLYAERPKALARRWGALFRLA
ncbi:CHAD domain-containing protein [Pseudoroseicyclus sp. CXY001]|uniref:CHAD domain-containing protein n=1 Tax=Pseudoroseicyclus sp. CXY001 TaxID=3242492 RepID=UPI003571411C